MLNQARERAILYGIPVKEYGNLNNAVSNAEKLEKKFIERNDYANHNPCTMVHKFIEELKTLTKID